MSSGYIVTGTDTDIGKTVVAAGLVAALEATYWKPIQSGLEGPTDSETVAKLANLEPSRIIPEAYRLRTPCSPHEAARLDGVSIDRARLILPTSEAKLIVEGAGGLMVPVSGSDLMIDLFADWGLPVILVARTKLGTINHSLLSIAALRQRGIEPEGVIFVGEENASSEAAIAAFGEVPHLGRLEWLEPLTPETLARAMKEHVRLDLLQ